MIRLLRLASLLVVALTLALTLALPARAFETAATSAWVYDITTKTVLMDKNGDTPEPPASMSKLMTINMLFEALKDGRVTNDTTFSVSPLAVSFTAAGGSTMYLQESDRPTVAELIQGMVVNSGNDATVVVAEGLAGSEAAFATQMNERAKALGLQQSNFVNASGWPDPAQRMSMRDLGLLGAHLIETFPDLYPVFSQTEYNYKNRAPANANNRNPLLKLNIGADGLKTGHTDEAGYGFTGSAEQNGRRLIVVMAGMTSFNQRIAEGVRLMNWGFNAWTTKPLYAAGAKVGSAKVQLGSASDVSLVAPGPIALTLPAGLGSQIKSTRIRYSGPLKAPIAKGAHVADLVVTTDNGPQVMPLVAGEAVSEAGFFGRAWIGLKQLLGMA